MIRTSLLVLLASLFACAVVAETPPPAAKAPDADAKKQEQKQIDVVEDPVAFHLVQLAAVESSLKAVDEALAKAGHQSTYMSNKASEAENRNAMIQALSAGPVTWDKFYDKTTDKMNGHSHTTIVVEHRPVPLDLVSRSSELQTRKAKEDVTALSGKIDKLMERKRQLEKEQMALWGQISASLIAQREIALRPLYSFRLKADDKDAAQSQQVATLEAYARYLRMLDRTTDYLEHTIAKDQPRALGALKLNMEDARKNLLRDLANVNPEIRAQTDSLADLAKRLTAVTRSAEQSHDLVLSADAAGDDARKISSRGLMQTAMVDLADKTTDLDDAVTRLADDWKITPATDKPVAEVQLTISSNSAAAGATPGARSPSVEPAEAKGIDLLAQIKLPDDALNGTWKKTADGIESDDAKPAILRFSYTAPSEYDFRVVFKRLSGVNDVDLVLAKDDMNFMWEQGSFNNTVFGFDLVNGNPASKNSTTMKAGLTTGRKYTTLVKVRKNSVAAYLDGSLISELKVGKATELKLRPKFLVGSGLLGLATQGSPTIIYSAEVVPFSGEK